MSNGNKKSYSHVIKIVLITFRLLGLGVGLFWFIWQNVFSLIVPASPHSNKVADFLSWMGVLYGIVLCGTFMRIRPKALRYAYNALFGYLSFGVIVFLAISVLWVLIFTETLPLFFLMELVNLLLITTVIVNTKIVLWDVNIFDGTKKVLYATVCIFSLIFIALIFQWKYFAQPIICFGESMTTAGNIEPWQYTLPRFHCWQYRLWSTP